MLKETDEAKKCKKEKISLSSSDRGELFLSFPPGALEQHQVKVEYLNDLRKIARDSSMASRLKKKMDKLKNEVNRVSSVVQSDSGSGSGSDGDSDGDSDSVVVQGQRQE